MILVLPMPRQEDPLVAEIASLRREIRDLADLLRKRTPLAPKDRTMLELLVPTVTGEPGTRGSVCFSTADLLADLDRHPDLLLRLREGLGAGDLPRRLGKLLSRARGREINGLALDGIGYEGGSSLWILKRV